DEFWRERSLWKFMNNVKCAVLNVGGWYDAEDPVGPFHIYRAVEKNDPGTVNMLVMGPWSHGGWSRGDGDRLANVSFGVETPLFFGEQIRFIYLRGCLKNKQVEWPKALMSSTGLTEGRRPAQGPRKAPRRMPSCFTPARDCKAPRRRKNAPSTNTRATRIGL